MAVIKNKPKTEYTSVPRRVVDEFNAEAARLDAIAAKHGPQALAAELAGVPWEDAQGFGPSFAPKAD